eukprot:CAMPEP_0206430882 /NCGR_PEP_ID=MMETSP0324_2-20121206/7060_1 /ASSEMBLY_ACC=CAM_ASM_000836 /TAXON_ID=2866 /ORGANISM="Crypthecodinium cohnii, Strain Seligo" /LENGTH=541 /DNA_ID=CAMNT_0053896757 /DNA_START=81 /DNA_END=1706 /DNA_ORIENTATION=+
MAGSNPLDGGPSKFAVNMTSGRQTASAISREELLTSLVGEPALPLRARDKDRDRDDNDGDDQEDSEDMEAPSSNSNSTSSSSSSSARLPAVCFIAYFNVSGGAWGSEGIISDCGPLPGFLGIFIFMWMWGWPVVLVTSELASAFPADGGYSIWVAEAFGEFWGFQESYLSWTSGVVDNALYPVLAYQTAARIFGGVWGDPLPDEDSPAEGFSFSAYLIKLILVALFTIPNLMSTRSYGTSLGLAFAMVAIPFIVFACASLATAGATLSWGRLLEVKHDANWSDWSDLFSNLYWNWNGFDCVSTCAGEVKNPERSYLRGLSLSMVLILFSYLVPLGVGVVHGAPDWKLWDAGWFSTIADQQVGRWMSVWIVGACFVGNFGQYSAELFEDSWQLAGMADAGLAPKFLGRRHKYFGTPWVSIIMQVCCISVLVSFDFSSILVVDNCFSVAGTMLELAAFMKLRISRPDLERPWAIPIQKIWVLGLFLLFPFVLGTIVFLSCFYGESLGVCLTNVALLCGGPAVFWLSKKMGHREYSHYDQRHIS